jgi:hypothetical protein
MKAFAPNSFLNCRNVKFLERQNLFYMKTFDIYYNDHTV